MSENFWKAIGIEKRPLRVFYLRETRVERDSALVALATVLHLPWNADTVPSKEALWERMTTKKLRITSGERWNFLRSIMQSSKAVPTIVPGVELMSWRGAQ